MKIPLGGVELMFFCRVKCSRFEPVDPAIKRKGREGKEEGVEREFLAESIRNK